MRWPLQAGYLNLSIRSGNLLITSGHTSDLKGVLGKDLTVEQGYEATKYRAQKILQSVYNEHGTLDDLRVVKPLDCVYSAPDFTDQYLVINGASDLLQTIYGKETGFYARSALGFAALPTRQRSRSKRFSKLSPDLWAWHHGSSWYIIGSWFGHVSGFPYIESLDDKTHRNR